MSKFKIGDKVTVPFQGFQGTMYETGTVLDYDPDYGYEILLDNDFYGCGLGPQGAYLMIEDEMEAI